MNPSRRQALRLSYDLLLEVVRAIVNVPADSIPIDVVVDRNTRTFYLVLVSEKFPELPEGAYTPTYKARWVTDLPIVEGVSKLPKKKKVSGKKKGAKKAC